MNALVWEGPRSMRVVQAPLPEPGAGEVLIRVDRVGICGSELSGYLGQNALRVPPLVMGHEFSGTVEGIGEGVHGVLTGDAVAVNPLLSCGACPCCRSGVENLCPDRKLLGAHRAGAFADYVSVPAAACTPITGEEERRWAFLAEPLACAVRAVEKTRPEGLRALLVQGCGAIGLFCIEVAKRRGVPVVLATDTNEGRLLTARRWGATRAINPLHEDLPAAIRGAFASGVDAVIDCVGSSATRRASQESVHAGGLVVFVGLHEAETPLDVNDVVRREVAMAGSFAYTRADFSRALEQLAGGFFRTGNWLEERPLDEGHAAFEDLVENRVSAAKIALVCGRGI